MFLLIRADNLPSRGIDSLFPLMVGFRLGKFSAHLVFADFRKCFKPHELQAASEKEKADLPPAHLEVQ